ncbi:MAG: aminotransferase class I/II-fold pyridoxal phosphate-dependent enzyme [Candidatus Eisenbacteria bacterium]|nr:aminotransferase class I/II-fold pyridoxal phosphate-dependent enzyme [Candidatus Eisenbacteria bacterium]
MMRARPGPLHPLLTGEREYPFVTLDQRRRALLPRGTRAINFGMGDPRERTPEFIRETLRGAVPETSSYPSAFGQGELRAACARWLERRFGVRADPERHVLSANGAKEAVFSLALALVDRGSRDPRDRVVIPTPAYPVYESGARFAGAQPYFSPLSSEDGWRFDPRRVPDDVWSRTALLWLGSPHNPTGAVLELPALARVLETAKRFGFWVAADEAYCEVYFENRRPHSMLELGFENVIALHTLSKRSAMTGFRSGFMAGDERLIAALKRFRPNLGTATPDFVQAAAIAAWNDDAHPGEQRGRYARKRAAMLEYFATRGWSVEASEASFYLWMKVPDGDDAAFVDRLLRVGIIALPGSFLGKGGEGFVRWALVPTPEDCALAIARLEAVTA